mgnify:CR=1 FL=1
MNVHVQRQSTGLLGCNQLRLPSLLGYPTRSALTERRSNLHGYQVKREQKVAGHNVKAEGRKGIVRIVPLLILVEENSARMHGQPADIDRTYFEPLDHAVGLGQLVKWPRHQMRHDHQGNEKDSSMVFIFMSINKKNGLA